MSYVKIDFYEILEVDKNSSLDEIKKSCRVTRENALNMTDITSLRAMDFSTANNHLAGSALFLMIFSARCLPPV